MYVHKEEKERESEREREREITASIFCSVQMTRVIAESTAACQCLLDTVDQ